MRKDQPRDNLYFVQLNFKKDKHESLIAWIKEKAEENEQSLSSFCINLIKKYFEEENDDR